MTGLFILGAISDFCIAGNALFFGAGGARYEVQFGKLGQHLVGKFYAALGLVKGEVTSDGFFDKVPRADFIFAFLQHKTYKPDCTILLRSDGRLALAFGFLFGGVV